MPIFIILFINQLNALLVFLYFHEQQSVNITHATGMYLFALHVCSWEPTETKTPPHGFRPK